MHSYATDAVDRRVAPVALALLAIASAYTFGRVCDLLTWHPPWWAEAPSVMGFYGGFHLLYDRMIWRWRVLFFSLSSIPYIGGTWAGSLVSTHEPGESSPVVVRINQTWSRILVQLETDHSRSSSTMAALYCDDQHEKGLKYEYVNQPRAMAVETMHDHRGTAHLRISLDRRTLDGDYYTVQRRGTGGDLKLHRVSFQQLERSAALALLANNSAGTGPTSHQPPSAPTQPQTTHAS